MLHVVEPFNVIFKITDRQIDNIHKIWNISMMLLTNSRLPLLFRPVEVPGNLPFVIRYLLYDEQWFI